MVLDQLKKVYGELRGLLFIIGSIFVFLSLISFSSTDPSLSSFGSVDNVQNLLGIVGSFTADIILQAFGFVGWLLVASLFVVGVRSFYKKEGQPHQSVAWISFGIIFLSLCVLTQLLAEQTNLVSQDSFWSGGLGGYLLVKAVRPLFSFWGTLFIFSSLLTLAVYSYLRVSLGINSDHVLYNSVAMWFRYAYYGSSHFFSKGFELTLSLFKNAFFFKWIFRSKNQNEAAPIQSEFISNLKSSVKRKSPDAEEGFRSASFSAPVKNKETSFGAPERQAKKAAVEKSAPKKIFSPKKKSKGNWALPEAAFLVEDVPVQKSRVQQDEIRHQANLLVEKLSEFKIGGQVINFCSGPAVTLFEFKPEAGISVNRITNLADDLALALSSESIRIIAPIPGRDVVGIEVANKDRQTVYLGEVLKSPNFWSDSCQLPVPLGKNISGEICCEDLAAMPHMMVAGSTGSGKSVFTVSFITSLIYKFSPEDLKLVLVDPKQVDLSVFSKLPHLMFPIIHEPHKAVNALKALVREMEKRYISFKKFRVRKFDEYNAKVANMSKEDLEHHKQVNEETQEWKHKYYYEKMSYIVVVVEEFADLMAVDKKNVESLVVRLAQMARAAGMHLILAMQSPRKEVVTGLIKTNIPGRISFKVAGKMDSRIILDESGAENLLSKGDMLMKSPKISKPQRFHGPWLSDECIQKSVDFWSDQNPDFEFDKYYLDILDGLGKGGSARGSGGGLESSDLDSMYDEILAFVATKKDVSASLIQRQFRIGYPRAARLMDQLTQEGVVAEASGAKGRRVLINEIE